MEYTEWIYNGKPIKLENIENHWGFVYKIQNSNGEFYIGSKSFFSRTNGKISKKRSNELYSGKGRKPLREKKIKESDWKTYKSSSKKVQEMISKNPHDFKFYIIKIFNTKAEMLLYEAFLIIENFLMKNHKILNEWVNIKSFKIK